MTTLLADVVTWIDADGNEYPMECADTLSVVFGSQGRFSPRSIFATDAVPFQPGQRVRSVTHDVRDISVPVLLHADQPYDTGVRALLRSWARRFNALAGLGQLKVEAPDGSLRWLNCYMVDGWGIDESLGNWGIGIQPAVLIFRAFDPYWYDVTATTQSATGITIPFFPFFPLRLSPVDVATTFTIDNTGDVDVWPIWTLTGPAVDLSLADTTTGESLSMTYSLASGNTLTIDTTPGAKTIELQDGTNLWQYLDIGSSLFPLTVGINNVDVAFTGSSSASTLTVAYRRGYLAP